MLTQQQIFNHCCNYFQDRINNFKGKLVYGYGSPCDYSHRCAIGSLIKEENKGFTGDQTWLIRKVSDLLGDMPSRIPLCKNIMDFNDSRAEQGQLKQKDLDFQMKYLADKFGLVYSSKTEFKTSNILKSILKLNLEEAI